jgi:hypothetical protein
MNTYTVTIKSSFGGATTIAIQASNYRDALVIAQSQWGDRVIYVEN